MKIHLDTSGDNTRIEIIPLIDVVFCILIFFILAALQLTRQQNISVDLPTAKTATLQTAQTLIVTVDALGKIYVDEEAIPESQLYLILEGYRRTNPAGLMLLYADRNAIYNDVISILDMMRSVGGDRVALATLPPNSDGTPALGETPAPNNFQGLDPLETFPTFPTLDQLPTPSDPTAPTPEEAVPNGANP